MYRIPREDEELSKENILAHVDQFDVFYYYIDGFREIGEPFCSELRANDNRPSCSISERDGVLFYKDFGDGTTTNCFGYVMKLLNVSYWRALEQISVDFELGLHTRGGIRPYKDQRGQCLYQGSKRDRRSHPILYQVRRRKWNTRTDQEYWGTYGIRRSTLDFFNVSPVTDVWINGNLSMSSSGPKDPIYASKFARYVYKFLAPYREREYKWRTNAGRDHIQGMDQLPWVGNLIVITKSMKDIMVLYEHGVSAIAPQSEGELISQPVMDLIMRRFRNIVVLFDNDDAGIRGSERYIDTYPRSVREFIPTWTQCKDISDLYEQHGPQAVRSFVQERILIHEDRIDL